jgi:hypothetical protein
MKRSLMSTILFAGVAAATYAMSEDAPAVADAAPVAPTKESLIQRIEDLFAKGMQGVENLLHDAISVVEEAFSGDEDSATIDLSLGNDAAATPTEPAAPVATGDAAEPQA